MDFVRLLAKVPEPFAQRRRVVLTLAACPPSALQRESGSRLRACEHLLAFCACVHDSMASTVGRVRALASKPVSTERAPRPPSSIRAGKRQHAAEHGVAVPRHTLCFK